jgi:hypothetical protein
MNPTSFLPSSWIFALVWLWCIARHARLLLHFRRRIGRFPNSVYPGTVEEKFLWRKLFDHNPLFVTVTDKLQMKEYVHNVVPDLKQARLLWFGDDPRAIPDSLLRGNVAVKANNGSRQNVLIFNRGVDRAELEREVCKWLFAPYGQQKGEWAYRHVRKGVLIEELLLENGVPVCSEFKFHVGCGRTSYVYTKAKCGSGKTREIVLSRQGAAFAIDDVEGMPLTDFELTKNFVRLREFAEVLAQPFDFIRCDLYDIDGEVYFSELTVYPSSGYGTVKNRKLNEQRNRDWDIRRSWFLSTPQKGWRRLYAEALLSKLRRAL